ncbi:hypothetical protein Tco_1368170 [Tanacetum coccineum]
MTPPPGFSTLTPLPGPKASELPPITASTFTARTLENTPLTNRVSTLNNPDPMINPAFIKANYEKERVVEFKDAPKREGSRVERNKEGGRPLGQIAEDNGPYGMNLPLLLAAHLGRSENGQPLQSGSLQATHEPSFQGSGGSFSFGGPPTYYSHGGYALQAPAGGSVPTSHRLIHPSGVFPDNYPFNSQPMYPLPNAPIYLNQALSGLFTDYTGCVTPFVQWIEDYPLPDGLKMPSHVRSYDGKGDLKNFVHLFEGAIRVQKWAMPVACHMFTYTLKDSARIWWNVQKIGSILNYEDLKGPNHGLLSNMSKSPREVLATEKVARTFEQPPQLPRRPQIQHESVSRAETSNRRSCQIRTASTSSERSKERESKSFELSIRRMEEGRQRYNTNRSSCPYDKPKKQYAEEKPRSMLLMALPNEHLMTFNQYKYAKTLFAAIQTRFGGNEATKKTQNTLLKHMYENLLLQEQSLLTLFLTDFRRFLPSEWNTHVVVWRNKLDLDTMSFDDLYNNFKIVEQEVKGTASLSSSSISTSNTQVSPSSTQVSTANLSDDTVYAFLASQPNGSQLVYEHLEQIHEDDIDEMDLKWKLALLTMRTRRGVLTSQSLTGAIDPDCKSVSEDIFIEGLGSPDAPLVKSRKPVKYVEIYMSQKFCGNPKKTWNNQKSQSRSDHL